MPWKSEIDRLVHHAALDAARSGETEARRAAQAVLDLLELAPDREASQFHVGALQEALETREEPVDLADLLERFVETADGSDRWRHLGRLDAASRKGSRERLRELMEDESFDQCIERPEGRVALRAVGRMMLRDGRDKDAFSLYLRHLGAIDDEGSRRDAEFLLEESLRRADRGDVTEEETLERLARARSFSEEAQLDARAQSKVDRKLGRVHQLAAHWEDAQSCYRRALERLPEDDPYRSVLVGDLALATLGVRGTLDLLPVADRENADTAEAILRDGQAGEGRSYNAIYTMGMLAYERGDHETGAKCFREADQLMRDNRAKARIVHARSRFFLAHCLLETDVSDEEIGEVSKWITRGASAVSLPPEIKDPVFAALNERKPDARVPAGRGGGRRGGGGQAPSVQASGHLEAAQTALQEDPHKALEHIDRAFKSRPDFDTWLGAYRARLDALVALNERTEALRTYERFRAKLYEREAFPQLETFLKDAEGPIANLLDETAFLEELVDLYEVMPERADEFPDVCLRAAQSHLDSGEPWRLSRAVALLKEAAGRDPEGVREALEGAVAAAQGAGALEADMSIDDAKDLLKDEEDPVRLLVVGGDKSRKSHVDRFHELAKAAGFEGEWIFTGVRPPYKTIREIQGAAQDADVILVHHAVGSDLREEVKGLGQKLDVPVRDAAWLGTAGVDREVLRSLKDAFIE